MRLCPPAVRYRPSLEGEASNIQIQSAAFHRIRVAFPLAKPEVVIGSEVTKFPVPLLPVLDGLKCLEGGGCDYLCVSTKRMQNHWMSIHGRHGTTGDWQPVPLQTFFRGNLLRYFTEIDPQAPYVRSQAQCHHRIELGRMPIVKIKI